ncbi:MAG TPA: hypothetical protein ACFYEK_08390 [Candidatus Wunengus sp. YC60]|uniref:hypothetical protein n=1 Tax=Candidatus Wunengus sp. YC60 TaxID=3367697 RepID=UPI004028C24B
MGNNLNDLQDEGGDFASLLVVAVVGIGGIIAGWVAKQVLGDRKLRSELEMIKQHIGLQKTVSAKESQVKVVKTQV